MPLKFITNQSLNHQGNDKYVMSLRCVNKIITMQDYYRPEEEDRFVQEFKARQNTLRSLQNSSLQRSKSLQSYKPKNNNILPQTLVRKRVEGHIENIKGEIITLEQHCSKYGGSEFIRREMDRNEMKKEQYLQYCLQRISNKFALPQIKQRSRSQKALPRNPEKGVKQKLKYNKWFIPPSQRFSERKQQTKYEWNNESFILNIVKKKGSLLENNRYLPQFVAFSKERIHRQPIFCKYSQVKKIQ